MLNVLMLARSRFAVVLAAWAVFWPSTSFTKVLDPYSREHPFLETFVDKLDARGIDVRRSWAAPVDSDRPILSDLVGSLATMPAAKRAWMEEFQSGTMGALAAMRGPADMSASEFLRKWKTSPAKKVFLSFASRDLHYALEIRDILERDGYAVFVFKAKPGRPEQAVRKAAEYYATADHYLLLDTKNSRESAGVWLEKFLIRDSAVPSIDKRRSDRPAEARIERHIPRAEVYGRLGCPRTREALRYMREKGISVNFRDVDTDPMAAVEARLSGISVLPLIKIDGRRVPYDAGAIDAACGE